MKRPKHPCELLVKRRETKKENACGASGRHVTVKGEIAEMNLVACARHRKSKALRSYAIITED